MRKTKKTKGQVAPEATPELRPDKPQSAEDAANSLMIYGNDPYSLTLPDTMHESDYLGFGAMIGKAMEFASWKIGDWVNFGKKKFGYKDYDKLSGSTGLSEVYLRQCSSVADRIPAELRAGHSLEKFRLMLPLQDKENTESIKHLVDRLGKKSIAQLREMSKGKSGDKKQDDSMTATELHNMLDRIAKVVPTFPNERITVYSGIDKEGATLKAARDVLFNLSEAVEAAIAEADARADAAKADAEEKAEKKPF